MKIFKKILLGLLIVFILIQVFRPDKNSSGNTANDISKIYAVPEEVKTILVKACFDCHSNKTKYPWYAQVQPVSWWLSSHIKDGKRGLNFNEFAKYRIAKQYKRMEDCIDQVKDGEMPLPPYTWIHKNAQLTQAEKEVFLAWCNTVRESIRAKYPTDSILIKKK